MDRSTFAERFLNRTARLLEPPALQRLRTCRLLIAGCGGLGAAVALTMARLGVGRFVLADPGRFDEPDINRQWGADTAVLGRNKAQVYREWLTRVNPHGEITAYTQGVTWDNVAALVADADVVIDCMDISVEPQLRGELFARAAAAGAYSVTAPVLGFGTFIAIAAPDGSSMAPVGKLVTEAAVTGRLPAFARQFYAPATVTALERDLRSGRLPSLSIGPVLAGAMVSAEVLMILLRGHSAVWREPVCLPRVILADAFTGRQKVANLADLAAEPAPAPERRQLLRVAHYNTNLLHAGQVAIDWRTDAWSELSVPAGDETAPASIAERFRDIYAVPHMLTVSRGRAAEAVAAAALVKPGTTVAANALFPSARFHLASRGATIVELPLSAGEHEDANLDIERLDAVLKKHAVACVWVEACANALGGVPISLANLRQAQQRCRGAGVPLVLDATRLLDNVVLRAGSEELADQVRRFTQHCDLLLLSASKDFQAPGGGFLAVHDARLLPALTDLVLAFGAALPPEQSRALAAAMTADPFRKVRERVAAVRTLHERLTAAHVPLLQPAGGHAVVIDAGQLLPHLRPEQFPAQALANALYLQAGIRGSTHLAAPHHQGRALLRLALPVGQHEPADLQTVVDVLAALQRSPESVPGLRLVDQPPGVAGSFQARYGPEVEA